MSEKKQFRSTKTKKSKENVIIIDLSDDESPILTKNETLKSTSRIPLSPKKPNNLLLEYDSCSKNNVNLSQTSNTSTSKIKKQTQSSISSFVKPIENVNIPQDADDAADAYKQALDSIKLHKIFEWRNSLYYAKRCSPAAFDSIKSDFFKYALGKRKDDDKSAIYDIWISRFNSEHFEDSRLKSTLLPKFKVAPENMEDYTHIFGDCLEVSEFLNTFTNFMQSDSAFAAVDISKAIISGYQGYYGLTSMILMAFMHVFKEYEILGRFKFFGVFMDHLNYNYKSVSEVVKMLVVRRIQFSEADCLPNEYLEVLPAKKMFPSQVYPEYDLPRLDENIQKRFLKTDFCLLTPEDQLAILKNLMEICYLHPNFIAHFEENPRTKVKNEEELLKRKKALETILNSDRSVHAKKDAKRDLNKMKASLKAIEIDKLQFRLGNDYNPKRIVLGKDRFHRKYHFFNNELNPGIYISEEPPFRQYSEADDNNEFKNDELATSMKYLVESTFPKFEKSKWYHLSTKEELDELIGSLNKKGRRENKLLSEIGIYRIFIDENMKTNRPNETKWKNESAIEPVKREAQSLLKVVFDYGFLHPTVGFRTLNSLLKDSTTFEDLRAATVTMISSISPCAFPACVAGVKFISYLTTKACFEFSKTLCQLSFFIIFTRCRIIKTGILDNTNCRRCEKKFAKTHFPTSCIRCHIFIHENCALEVEQDPLPSENSWVCKKCKIKDGELPKDFEEDEKEFSESESEKEIANIIVGNRALRATKQRVDYLTAVEEETSRPNSSNSRIDRKRKKESSTETNDNETNDGYDSDSGMNCVSVDDDVLKLYEELVKDYRLLQHLSVVLFKGPRGLSMNVVTMKKHLHLFENVEDFYTCIQKLYKAALKHFELNIRQYSAMKDFFTTFLEPYNEQKQADRSMVVNETE